MSERQAKHLWGGIAAGVVGGLVGSWLMMRFIEGPGPFLQQALGSGAADDSGGQQQNHAASVDPDNNVTMQAADTFVRAATGGRHLTYEDKLRGGTVVHYAFGAVMGGLYGGAAEFSSIVGLGLGSAFGTLLWAGTDLVAVPAVGFAALPTEEPTSAHVAHWLAHVVYAVGMESSRRLMRAAL